MSPISCNLYCAAKDKNEQQTKHIHTKEGTFVKLFHNKYIITEVFNQIQRDDDPQNCD